MTQDDFETLLVRRITEKQGCKAMELVADPEIIDALKEISEMEENTRFDLLNCLGNIVKKRRVIEIEYVLPEMSYRTKSFYLPANTQVRYSV